MRSQLKSRRRPGFGALMALLLVCVVVLPGSLAMAQSMRFYVAANGRDTWSGALAAPNDAGTDGPFQTLEGARDAIRRVKQERGLPEDGITVYVRGGTYERGATFALTEEDAGSPSAPIVYRSFNDEEVRLTGGRAVTGFHRVADPALRDRLGSARAEQILVADLRAQGITDYGEMRSRGFGRPVYKAGLELFFNDKPMTLARYPNDGWLKIVDTPEGADGGQFTYEDDVPKTWQDTASLWVHGYWTYDWADSYERVAALDADAGLVKTVPPHGVYGYKKGQRFYFLNALDLLDAPGEWFLDRERGLLYFWPPSPIEEGRAVVSVLDTLVTLDNTSYVTLRGFTFEACRGDAIEIRGGTQNRIAGSTIRNTGNRAVVITGGTFNGVAGSDIYDTGDGGISLSGGDRQTLTPAYLYAENNDIYRYSRWSRTYRPAVAVSGVGNRVAHNRIHDAPHMGVSFGGNNHVLEYNEVYNVAQETGDVGAFYTGRDWTTRGTIIRYNFFHHITGPFTFGAMSVYLDDSQSGITVTGNVFYKASRAAFIGGGRDNIVSNNIFVDNAPSVHIDARALGWAKKNAVPGGDWHMYQKLEAVNYREPPYSTRYPQLPGIVEDEPAVPKGNIVTRNISVGGKWIDIAEQAKPGTVIEDNFTEGDPLFVDPEHLNFQLRPESPAWAIGFEPIPFERIGLVRDGYRTIIPPRPTW